MNPQANLNIIFYDLLEYMDSIVSDYGAPCVPQQKEIEKLKNQIVSNPANSNQFLQKNFFLIERLDGEILYSFNCDRFLSLTDGFNLKDFLSLIDDGTQSWDYLKDYLSWAKSAYGFVNERYDIIDFSRFSYRIRFPMILSDRRAYWVFQEVKPFEVDASNHILSHINTYTIGNLYKEKAPIPLIGEFYYNDVYVDDWNTIIKDKRKKCIGFHLTSIQQNILEYFYRNPQANLKSCSATLKYPVNTLKKYISDSQGHKGILDKAKESFPSIKFVSLKHLVSFLSTICWFD